MPDRVGYIVVFDKLGIERVRITKTLKGVLSPRSCRAHYVTVDGEKGYNNEVWLDRASALKGLQSRIRVAMVGHSYEIQRHMREQERLGNALAELASELPS